MSGSIRLLAPEVADAIAAGEVIERPDLAAEPARRMRAAGVGEVRSLPGVEARAGAIRALLSL